MKTFRFNTNVEGQEGLQQVSRTLNKERRIISFKIDVQDVRRPMEVSCTDGITEEEVKNLVREAGFQAADIDDDTIRKQASPDFD
jgi:hypothetical protein